MSENRTDLPETVEEEKAIDFPFEKVFIAFSIIFLLIAGTFYGLRYFDYANGAGKRAGTLAGKIREDNQDQTARSSSGLFEYEGIEIFRGSCRNNYVIYNGLPWRIMQINSDGSVRLISAEALNQLPFNEEQASFADSGLYGYLNGHFRQQLPESGIVNTVFNGAVIDDLTAMSEEQKSAAVSLCDVASYLNSMLSGATYLSDCPGSFWLSGVSSEGVYRAEDGKLTVSPSERIYQVRPVITLAADTPAPAGSGTREDPYRFEEENITIGSVIQLGDDRWTVYQIDPDGYRLVRNKALEEPMAFGLKGDSFDPAKEDTLAYHLNNDYLNSLSYKDLLAERDFAAGNYDGSLPETTVRCRVALASLKDIKLSEVEDYWLADTSERYAYVYGEQAELFKPTLLKNVVPVIAISRDVKLTGQPDGSYKAGE
ncbi:MAG: hypothetical protein IJM79_08840 [Erysipelotrichaceae bacterium]|nr:hypothetical protein [Erysipelotrichaceae bacterium]